MKGVARKMSIYGEGNFLRGLAWGISLSIPLWALIAWAAIEIL
jgi:hypothetical protein